MNSLTCTHIHAQCTHAYAHAHANAHTNTNTHLCTKYTLLNVRFWWYFQFMQNDPIGTILYSLVVRDADEGSNGEVSFTLNSPVRLCYKGHIYAYACMTDSLQFK